MSIFVFMLQPLYAHPAIVTARATSHARQPSDIRYTIYVSTCPLTTHNNHTLYTLPDKSPTMASKVTPVTSSAHFRTLTSSSTFTVVDFYADWCGPCKVISPVFEQLASAESKPGKIIFCKVDVDAQREIAGNYGVSAYVLAFPTIYMDTCSGC